MSKKINEELDWPECELPFGSMSIEEISEEKRKLGEIIKKRRVELEMSISDLSELSGVSKAFIARIENGQRINISYSIKESLFDALDIGERYVSTPKYEIDLKQVLMDKNYVLKYGDSVLDYWFRKEIRETILGIFEMLASRPATNKR